MSRRICQRHVRHSIGGKRSVSIIIPCYNGVMYTRRCLKSILSATRYPYELILVDNGSTDGTGTYLSGLARSVAKQGFPYLHAFHVIRNTRNRGVSGALNQGILRSKGQYVCYLNNDTVVSDGWLDRLRGHAERDEMIGIVGCCSHFSRGKVDSSSMAWPQLQREIPRIAAFISLKHNGAFEPARYIHGFCMFIKRTVIQTIGLFDEGFYPCSGEDFDYSIRARAAGFSLVIARDVMVYHFLRKSTTSSHFNDTYGAIDGIAATAYTRLKKKWGEEGRRCYWAP